MSDTLLLSLTPAERALLDDPAEAPRFSALELAGRSLDDLVVHGLTFDANSFAASVFQRVRFTDCRFEGAQFNETTLDQVRFERCVFSACRFEHTELSQVNLLECQLEETFWLEAHLLECRLERSELRNATFQGGSLQLTLQGGSIDTCILARCRVIGLQLSDVRVEGLRLSFCTSDRLTFQLCALERLLFVGGTCDSLTLYAGSVRDLKGAEFHCTRTEFESVSAIETLHLNACELPLFVLEDCARVEDLYVFQSKLGRMVWRGGCVAGWIADSTLGAGSRIERAVLQDVFLDDSRCLGLTLDDVELSRGFCARNARFIELRLVNLRYAPGLDLVLDGATFERSDSFARPA